MSIDSETILEQINMYPGRTFALYPVNHDGEIDAAFSESYVEVMSPEESIRYCKDRISDNVHNKKFGKMPLFGEMEKLIMKGECYLICRKGLEDKSEKDDLFYLFDINDNLLLYTNGRVLYRMNKTLLKNLS